jgi:hypothetical protein
VTNPPIPERPADDPVIRVALTLRGSDRERLYRMARHNRRTPSEQVAWLVDQHCTAEQLG